MTDQANEIGFLRWLYHHPELGPDTSNEAELFRLFEQETDLKAPRQVREFDEDSGGAYRVTDDDGDDDFPGGPHTQAIW